MKKKKSKIIKLSDKKRFILKLIEHTKRHIKGDDSSLDEIFNGQLLKLNKELEKAE